jgi:hypothetical protein
LTIVVSGIGSGGKLMPVEAEFIGTNVRYSLYREKIRAEWQRRATTATQNLGHRGYLEQMKQYPGKETPPQRRASLPSWSELKGATWLVLQTVLQTHPREGSYRAERFLTGAQEAARKSFRLRRCPRS